MRTDEDAQVDRERNESGSAPGAVTGPTVDRFRLDGKVAVVTGAGRCGGRGAAIALAEAGANVAVISRSRTDLDSVARVIHGTGHRCHRRALRRDI